ncbi:aminotransferase class IV [Legionella londiniensis]|uniref:Aminodeoxychorismate lyase n=1 Tax=Legionella londiniensis TaxID=45068 RepID=A0A0W0VLU6_9GAMM|nr:aminotransferase class IV [Legionella londiniensis]KTD21075.1 4-amino-4-deoxychorismate lyase [Legionella londiniensis]STX93651.1 4-amino-4-deoxychorismate lyase [Legionella londiniensis]
MSIAANDRILLGEGLFETIRFENRAPCYPKLHWQRLQKSATSLNISIKLTYQEWHAKIAQCIQETNLDSGGVKIILSAGEAPRGLEAIGKNPYFIFSAFPLKPALNALNLISAEWRRDPKNPVYRLKTTNYLEAILARKKALAQGADDALFFNTDSFATETTVANLFIIKENQVLTPSLSCGLLPGILRRRILDICPLAGIDCQETYIDYKMIMNAEAVFVTNALQGIRPVASFEAVPFANRNALFSYVQLLIKNDDKS